MKDTCWFCNENESNEDKVYNVAMIRRAKEMEEKNVAIPRCDECEARHRKGHTLSTLMYVGEVVLIAILLFVVKLDFIYVAIVYLILMRLLSDFSQRIRRATAKPYKAVCDVYQNEEVSELVEEGLQKRDDSR